jgi:hypothetical protein
MAEAARPAVRIDLRSVGVIVGACEHEEAIGQVINVAPGERYTTRRLDLAGLS